MSERFSAWIKIGGKIKRSQIQPLIKAIRNSAVQTDWGDAYFTPTSAEELLEAREDDWLFLCDDQARWGEFPEIENTCRRLQLGYRRHCDGGCVYDAELVDWRPGMKQPRAVQSGVEHDNEALIPASEVKQVLALLEDGKAKQAIDRLKRLCPAIPDLPRFQIV